MANKVIDYSVLVAKDIPIPQPLTRKKNYTKGPSHKLTTMQVGKCLEIPLGERSGNSVQSSIKTAAKRSNINIECRLDESEKILRVWRLA
jgi:hypothetical protein